MERREIIDAKLRNLKIVDISDEGKGIGRTSCGLIAFVENALPGDTVNAVVISEKKNYVNAKITGLVEPSPYRTEPRCPHADICGGCPFSRLAPAVQLEIKRRHVCDKLERIGGVSDPAVRPVIPSPSDIRYRNKAEYTISGSSVGFNAARSHDVFDCPDCLLQSEAAAACAGAVRAHIIKYGEKFSRLLVRTASTGDVMVMITSGGEIARSAELTCTLEEAAAGAGCRLKCFYKETRSACGVSWIGRIAGEETVTERIGDLTYHISPRSFFQVNTAAAKMLYDKVREYAGLSGRENVLDLYCGVGSIGLYCAKDAGFVLGIESVKDAVRDARENASANGIENAGFIAGRAEKILPDLVEGKSDADTDGRASGAARNADIVILDPPRAGCGRRLLEAAAMPRPEKIIYVSCDAGTLARDVKILRELGYEFIEASPVDMFAQTGHVETVVLMSRVEK
ncbi:MAG: 23S rRNA (uracil(1939)-C(5))-methyltransferase RlmD [Anaerovoracaceae bacterium]|nr:23S rRNA (uracil(1939)-C(5))-methyltransferase RlmD [Anaerovoracaceae bacterium]